jgi:AGCS family alanine or glycine:cation symporter
MNELIVYVDAISNFLFNTVLLFLLVGTGIYFTIRLRFVQVREFIPALLALSGVVVVMNNEYQKLKKSKHDLS